MRYLNFDKFEEIEPFIAQVKEGCDDTVFVTLVMGDGGTGNEMEVAYIPRRRQLRVSVDIEVRPYGESFCSWVVNEPLTDEMHKTYHTLAELAMGGGHSAVAKEKEKISEIVSHFAMTPYEKDMEGIPNANQS